MKYWENYLEPVKYTDGFYHIGSRNGPCWLLESDDGLILIDTGMPSRTGVEPNCPTTMHFRIFRRAFARKISI